MASSTHGGWAGILGFGLVIFLTVGTQLPFDRLVQWVDEWAGIHPNVEIVAQTGKSAVPFKHLQTHDFLPAKVTSELVERSDLVVAHAGMGSILTSLSLGTPIIVVPRLAMLGEHRNDHQVATARQLGRRAGISVANSKTELYKLLDAGGMDMPTAKISPYATTELIDRLEEFFSGKQSSVK